MSRHHIFKQKVIQIHYPTERDRKGNVVSPPCKRTIFITEKENLDEVLSKAWREDAHAEIFDIDKPDTALKAGKTKGIWEQKKD